MRMDITVRLVNTMRFDYYYGNEAEQYSFYRVPKALITDPKFKGISAESKLLYGLLLDRMGLSIKNCWLDGQNRVYIIFTIDEIMECLSCAEQKAIKLLKELESDVGLIERKRQGLGKPNIIYVKNFIEKDCVDNSEKTVPESQIKNCENHNSGTMKITNQELRESRSNNTDNNNTDLNETDIVTEPKTKDAGKAEKRCDDFKTFIRAYPNVPFDEKDAWRMFKTVSVPCDELLKSLDYWKQTPQWQNENGRYIPSPQKFLANGYYKVVPKIEDDDIYTPLPETICKNATPCREKRTR